MNRLLIRTSLKSKTPPPGCLCWRSLLVVLVCAIASPLVRPAAVSAYEDNVQIVDFDRDVRPILAEHCLRCHGPDARARKANLRLDLRSSVYADRGEYRIVNPQNPEKSELLIRITSGDPALRMPPTDVPEKDRLSRAQINVVSRWLQQGADWAQHWSCLLYTSPSPRD